MKYKLLYFASLADRERADAMYAARGAKLEPGAGLREDRFAFRLRERAVGLVVEPLHFARFVVIAYPAFERHAAARSHVRKRALFRVGVDRRIAERKTIHPPETGGRNTTSSPSASA